MAYILDSLNSEDDTGRIEQLEAELESVRNTFEEYVSTTEGLEVEVKTELREMQRKLNNSTSANKESAKKSRSMETLLRNSELTSEGTRGKLKTEAKLRRQAEKVLAETELELRSNIVKIRQLERNDSSTLRIVDSGVITEMVNNTSKGFTDRELEAVTDELITTQEKLRKAEEQLQRSQTLVQDLEKNLQNIDNEFPQSLSGDNKELLRELDEIRAEIDAARSDVQSQSTGTELSKDHTSKHESELEECREENLGLIEEITCLRNILYDQGTMGTTVDEKVQMSVSGTISTISMEKIINEMKEEHKFEIKSLRKHIEEILNENMDLQEMVRKLEIVSSSQKLSNDDKFKLQEEVNRLELRMAHEEYERATKEVYQRKEVQQEGTGKFNLRENIEVIDDDIIGVKFANDLISCVEDLTIDEKLRKTERILIESEEECSGMRSEILALTESLYNANQTQGETMFLNEEIINLTGSRRQDDAHFGAQNEVEDKKREIITLKNNLMSTQEEVRLLSEEISYMSSAFEKAQDEYNSIIEELQQTESALAAAKDTRFSQEIEMERLESVAEKTPQKNAEICLLKTQFEKLNEKNENLARQVKDAESEVLSVREKQDKARSDTKARVIIAKELQDDIDQAVSGNNERNREVEELAFMVENRMSTTERNLEMLESEIAVAIGTLRTAQVASLGEKSKPFVSIVLQNDSLSTDSQSVEIDSNTNAIVDKEKAPAVEINTWQSTLEQSRHLLEIIETVEKPTSQSKNGRSDQEGQLNDDDRTAITTASLSTNSMHSYRKNSKYEEIIQKVANYESLSLCSKENRELETRGDVGIEERE